MASKDTRLFARLDLDYADHPKIVVLSDAAFRAHIEMILYARRHLTDGVIPNRVANRLGFESLSELQNNDPDSPSLVQLDNGDYLLHGYEDMNETKDDVQDRIRRNSRNGARGGRPKGSKKTQSVTESVPQSVPESQTDWGTQKKAETETETDTSLLRREGATSSPRPRAHRLPDNWTPSPALREAMAHECPRIDQQAEHRKFVDHWRAQPDSKARKVDWDATWRNWIRRANENNTRPTASQRNVEAGRRLHDRVAQHPPTLKELF